MEPFRIFRSLKKHSNTHWAKGTTILLQAKLGYLFLQSSLWLLGMESEIHRDALLPPQQ